MLFNTLSRFVIAFLPRRKCLLISLLQLLSTVILEPKKIKFVTVSAFSPSIGWEVMGLDAIALSFTSTENMLLHLLERNLQDSMSATSPASSIVFGRHSINVY